MNGDMASMAQLASLASNSPVQQQSPDDGNSSGTKRKGSDGQPQQRAKRNRYISIACNECKRRKIKCNGNNPCQRCGNLNLECLYAPNCCSSGFKESQEYKDMSNHIASLQAQVNDLYENLTTLRSQLGQDSHPQQQQQQQHAAIDPSLQQQGYAPRYQSFSGAQASPGAPTASMTPNHVRNNSQSKQASFRGPTSSDFNFGVAKSSLQTMGITGDGVGEGALTGDATPSGTPPPQSAPLHPGKDPIWAIPQDEALRLCRVYEEEMGLMYPVVDISEVIGHATRLYRFIESAARTGLMQGALPGADSIEDEDTNILKLIMAITLTVEGTGRSDVGRRLFEYVQPTVDRLLLGNVGVKGLRLMTLAAMYEFHRDNEGKAWRLIGHTVRLCIELGLHRRETYDAMGESERSSSMMLFWAVYVLDRRWSFGTGMPFALQDQDIDPLLPKPQEDQSPYLMAMISYSAIGGKVWRTVATSASSTAAPVNPEEIPYLDFQVIEWHRRIPTHLRYEHPSSARPQTPSGPPPSRALQRLRITLYLRANQMRILIYRTVLHSATSIMEHRDHAIAVVDVAKDTIRVLTHINQTTDIYRTQQVLFNAFLTSALAVLFLAVSHTPVLFADRVREEFYMALELIRGFSRGSFVSKRLWKTIRVLKEVGPRLGLAATNNAMHGHPKGEIDPSRSAAVAMAGLAGHNVDEMALYSNNPQQWAANTGTSSSPEGMVNDLTSLFEAAGGYAGLGSDGQGANTSGSSYPVQTQGAQGMENMAGMFGGGEEGLSNILKELF